MKYALVVHKQLKGGVNIGDFIQCLAAKQFIPHVNFYVERDKLNQEHYEEAKVIMNGWFTYSPENWPPNKNLNPLFISFHLNPYYADKLLSKKENVEYLQKHSPIGCRDYFTLKIMQRYNINSYYSFCLTSTLDIKYKSEKKTDSIIFCDIMYKLQKSSEFGIGISHENLIKKSRRILAETIKGLIRNNKLKKIVPKDIYQSGIHLTQQSVAGKSNEEYFKIAEELLEQYASAKLVVTSRIHCALPCLALGTPVLFVPDGISQSETEFSRLKGIVEYLNILTVMPKYKLEKIFGQSSNIFNMADIDWDNPPKNPNNHIRLTEDLKSKCINFVNENNIAR